MLQILEMFYIKKRSLKWLHLYILSPIEEPLVNSIVEQVNTTPNPVIPENFTVEEESFDNSCDDSGNDDGGEDWQKFHYK